MAEISEEEDEEYASTGPVGAINATTASENVATEPLQYVGSEI